MTCLAEVIDDATIWLMGFDEGGFLNLLLTVNFIPDEI
jgi:hypothetical protein